MILRLSTKIQKKVHLNLAKEAEVPTAENPYLDWHCNLFTESRQQVIIFTNSASLLTVYSYGRGISDTNALKREFHCSLETYLSGTPQEMIYRNIIEKSHPTVWAKTNNRSVTGSMNDFIFGSKLQMERGYAPAGLADKTNRMPMKYLDYEYPVDVFKNMK